MKRYLITIDIDTTKKENPSPLYDEVEKFLESSFAKYCKPLKNVYLIATNNSSVSTSSIRENIKTILTYDDLVFVCELNGNYASWNYTSINEEINAFFKD